MNIQPFYKMIVLLPLLPAFLLLACGGGDTSGEGDNSGAASPFPPVVAAKANLSFHRDKIFRVNWTDVNDATYYRVLENPDGSSGYTQISGDIPTGSQSYDHYVNFALWDSLKASYILQSCNARGCNDDNAVFISDFASLTGAIGYFTGSQPDIENANDQFGRSVSLSEDGNTLAVGTPGDDNAGLDFGAVYVFVHEGKTWSQQAVLQPSNGATEFGYSVSLSSNGNTLAIGAPYEDSTANDSGAVYVFTRTGSNWSQQDLLKASSAGEGDNFGGSVSLTGDGNTLAVGASNEDSSSIGTNSTPNEDAPNSGATYIFTRSDSIWNQQYYIKPEYTGAGDNFGSSVNLSSNGFMLVVGAPGDDSNTTGFDLSPNDDGTADDSGAVYVFISTSSDLYQSEYIKASNTGAGDHFGTSVSVSVDTASIAGDGIAIVAVGAPGEDSTSTSIDTTPNDNGSDIGAVYIFQSNISLFLSSWTEQAYIKPVTTVYMIDDVTAPLFGASVSLTQDGNTLAVGAYGVNSYVIGINPDPIPFSSLIGGIYGAAYIYDRIGLTWSEQAWLKAINPFGTSGFGFSVSLSGSGDVFAVGAPAPFSNLSIGQVYLY